VANTLRNYFPFPSLSPHLPLSALDECSGQPSGLQDGKLTVISRAREKLCFDVLLSSILLYFGCFRFFLPQNVAARNLEHLVVR
jgi:hypothetical protein